MKEEINPVPKQSLLKLGEVSILLSSYNDIFSAFGPNEFAERTLSDDFFIQAKNFSKRKDGNKMTFKLTAYNEHKKNKIVKQNGYNYVAFNFTINHHNCLCNSD